MNLVFGLSVLDYEVLNGVVKLVVGKGCNIVLEFYNVCWGIFVVFSKNNSFSLVN